jgi:hypothetical protein
MIKVKEPFGSGWKCRHPAKAFLEGFWECAIGRLQPDSGNSSKDFIAMGEDPVIPDAVKMVFG